MTESAKLREIAEAQEAYGKWNTAPAWNRYYAARDAESGPVLRVARRGGELAFLAVGWLLAAAPLIWMIKEIF